MVPGPSCEVAWQDEPGITVSTHNTLSSIPEARVWPAYQRSPGQQLAEYKWHLRGDRICCYCGQPMFRRSEQSQSNQPDMATVEHVQPTSWAGLDVPENLVGCCRRCNTQRHELTVLEMLLFERTGLVLETEGMDTVVQLPTPRPVERPRREGTTRPVRWR